jgi:RND family efflux transporter MFP subunit
MRRPLPVLSVAALLASLAAACGRGSTQAATPAAPPRPAAAAPAAAAPSRLVEPARTRWASRAVATGTLKGRQAAPLAASVSGTLLRVPVRRGQEVPAGTLLASLDDAAAAAAVKQAEAAVGAARAQRDLAEDAFTRATRIREQDGVSEAQHVQARGLRDLAVAQLAAAEAQLEQARVHLAHHHLHAPFAGVVTQVPDGVGVQVSPGVPLVTLVTTRPLVLQTSLTQEEAAEVRVGTKVEVVVPASGARAGGAVSAVVPAVDPSTNRVPVEVTIPNGDGRLLPSAFARVELPRGAERDAYRVSAAALVQREGRYAVWAAGADARARVVPVRVLAEEGDAAIVLPDADTWPAGVRVVEAPPLGIAVGTLVAEAGR